jgi:hypothetical protein
VAQDKTKKRLRKLPRAAERQRRSAPARPLGPGPRFPDSQPPVWEGPDFDDPDDGAGVREPPRPWPTTPAAALELDEPEPLYLDLTSSTRT